jgi:hypothetical protein
MDEESRAPICKRLRSPGIDSKESITPAYVAWRAGTSNRVVIPARHAGNRFLGSLKIYKFGLRDVSQFLEVIPWPYLIIRVVESTSCRHKDVRGTHCI